jgi:Fe-S-cluster containining protein
MNRVEAVPTEIKGQTGYDIRVLDAGATVQEYIDAINSFIEEKACYRTRKPAQENCYGCDLCCQERAPVTAVDAYGLGEDLRETLLQKLHVCVEDRVVDIILARNDEDKCRLLNTEKGICTIYGKRPLVCQTFICCPSTKNAKQLREQVVNAGEDELVRQWFAIGQKSVDNNLIIHEAFEPAPDMTDYPQNAFAGAKNYSDVKLRDICSPSLWSRICKGK